jgi:hypothetical protein
MPITAADLHQGDYIAITAKRQPDNTLLASIVNVFPPSIGQVAPGQRPLPEGNLMLLATQLRHSRRGSRKFRRSRKVRTNSCGGRANKAQYA